MQEIELFTETVILESCISLKRVNLQKKKKKKFSKNQGNCVGIVITCSIYTHTYIYSTIINHDKYTKKEKCCKKAIALLMF